MNTPNKSSVKILELVTDDAKPRVLLLQFSIEGARYRAFLTPVTLKIKGVVPDLAPEWVAPVNEAFKEGGFPQHMLTDKVFGETQAGKMAKRDRLNREYATLRGL